MDFLYILPPQPDQTEWRIHPRFFTRALKKHWPNVKVHEIADPSDVTALEFELQLTGTLNGEFHREGQALIITYMQKLEDMGEVVAWFRTLAPPSQDLVLVSGPGDYVEIPAGMTGAEFVRKYLGGPSRPE